MVDTKLVDITCVESKDKLLTIKKDVQALFIRVFKKPLDDKAWEHYYINAPLGPATVFVCYRKGDLIGHGGIIPQELISKDGKRFGYYLQTAIMIDEKYRNLRPFKELMDTIHRYVVDRKAFVLAFPNDSSYLPFVKMLQWRKITEYNIRQYTLGSVSAYLGMKDKGVINEYRYFLKLDGEFLKWRGELNRMKLYKDKHCRIIYKDYRGALEILNAEGSDIDYRKLMSTLGYECINIPGCFLSLGSLKGLTYIANIGIPQRMCVYPGDYSELDYESIKASLLLSDIF